MPHQIRISAHRNFVIDLLDRVQELADGSRGEGGLSSGFPGIDRLTGGFRLGDLIVLAGAPSMGKTALANNMAAHVVLEQDLPVAVFSMELSALQFTEQMVSCVGRIQQRHLRNGKLTDEEWPRLTEAIEKLRPAPLAIDDDPGLNLSELRDKVLRLKQEFGTFGLVVVDGLQMMIGRWDYNLHGLKMLAPARWGALWF
jgi:replicative DNA helicase